MKDKLRHFATFAARLAVVAMLLCVSVPVAGSGPARPLGASNLLTNGDFEINASEHLADEWVAWPDSGDTAPEYYMSTTACSGERSQQVKSKAAHTHDGGFYQRVSTGITVGNAVSFGIWHNWPDDPKDGTQSVRVWIGLDPYGGTDADSSNVRWTADEQYATDYYQQLSLATTAMSTTVTVFARSQSQYPSDAYVLWDDAVVVSGPWQHVYLPLVARNYVPPCTLQNGGFEGTYSADPPYSNKVVAPYWRPWYHWEQDVLADPEYNETTWPLERVRSGDKSQQYGTTWKAHEAGVYQQVGGCTSGAMVRFRVWGQSFVARAINTSVSDPDGDLRMKIGIDPIGGTDYSSSNVVWSETVVSRDAWHQFAVTATVAGPTITVFTCSYTANTPIEQWFHNTSYWDDASLEKLP